MFVVHHYSFYIVTMKKIVTLLAFAALVKCFNAQLTDGLCRIYTEPTVEIEKLETQESELKMSGDLTALAVNRVAQIATWQKVDPEIASEFKMSNVDQSGNNLISGSSKAPDEAQNSPVGKYGTDLQLNSFLINHGVYLDTALNGDIHATSFVTKAGSGGNLDDIYIYKSTNKDSSFFLWGTATVPDAIRKMKISIMVHRKSYCRI